ncbi:helicase associated domain-containing protein [Arthrobacter sp. MDT1-65]
MPRPRARDHWEQRLDAYQAFLKGEGRRPSYEAAKGSEERSLAIWMMSQRKRCTAATLRTDRATALDAAVPGWRPLLEA